MSDELKFFELVTKTLSGKKVAGCIVTCGGREELAHLLMAIAGPEHPQLVEIDQELDDDEGEWLVLQECGANITHWETYGDHEKTTRALDAMGHSQVGLVTLSSSCVLEELENELDFYSSKVAHRGLLAVGPTFFWGELGDDCATPIHAWIDQNEEFTQIAGTHGKFALLTRRSRVLPKRAEEVEGSLGHFLDMEDARAPPGLAEAMRDLKTVYIQQVSRSEHPFIAGAPLPRAETMDVFHEPPFRGYLRGVLVAVTPSLGLVAVTHVAHEMPKDTHPQTQPQEVRLGVPQFRAFGIDAVKAWGPWVLGVPTGGRRRAFGDPAEGPFTGPEEVLQHIVPGSPYYWSEQGLDEIELFSTKQWLRLDTAAWWASSRHLQDVWVSPNSFVQQGFVSLPVPGVNFDPTELEVGDEDHRGVVRYRGVVIRRFDVLPDPENFDLDITDGAVQGYYNWRRVGDPVLLPPRVPSPFREDPVVGAARALVDGRWVGDLHRALHGVFQAMDRASGPTAMAGLSNTMHDASVGVALSLAAGGVGEMGPGVSDNFDPLGVKRAWNWIGYHVAITAAGLSGQLTEFLHPLNVPMGGVTYEHRVREATHNHHSVDGALAVLSRDVEDHGWWLHGAAGAMDFAARLHDHGLYDQAWQIIGDIAALSQQYRLDRWRGLVHR